MSVSRTGGSYRSMAKIASILTFRAHGGRSSTRVPARVRVTRLDLRDRRHHDREAHLSALPAEYRLPAYRMISGSEPVRLELRPSMNFRPHEGVLKTLLDEPYKLQVDGDRYEFSSGKPATARLENAGFRKGLRRSRSTAAIRRNCCTAPRRAADMRLAATCGVRGYFHLRAWSREVREPGRIDGALGGHARNSARQRC